MTQDNRILSHVRLAEIAALAKYGGRLYTFPEQSSHALTELLAMVAALQEQVAAEIEWGRRGNERRTQINDQYR